MNTAISDIDGLQEADTALRDYVDSRFDNLDFDEAAQNALDELVANGTMDSIVTPIIAEYANPVFVDSVNDMTAKDVAYANKENGFIYEWNADTSGYVSSGHLFGGIMDDVSDMSDTAKYYALSDNALLYKYNYSSGEWVSDNTVFGGYKNNVANMVPIGKTYVLKTNMHVYQWNGNEYVDSGVQYGVPDGVLLWRRKLTVADNVLGLSENGWYTFDANSLPQNTPQNMKADSGFLVVYGNNNPERELAENNSATIINEADNELTANSGIRITLCTANGGSWLWTGYAWINQSNVGFLKCDNCNNVNYNSSLYCDENTANKPDEHSGVLLTLWVESVKEQIFIGNNTLWFRTGNDAWIQVSSDERADELESEIQSANERMYALYMANLGRFTLLENSVNEKTQQAIRTANEALETANLAINTFGELQELSLMTADSSEIACENDLVISGVKLVPATDKELTSETLPANAKTTGERFDDVQRGVDNANAFAMQVQAVNAILANEVQTVKKRQQETETNLQLVKHASIEMREFSILTDNGMNIECANGDSLYAELLAQKTDTDLNDEYTAADAKTTGLLIKANANKIEQINELANANKASIGRVNSFMSSVDALLETSEYELMTENEKRITTNSSTIIAITAIGIKTDKTLSKPNIPADAEATGLELQRISQNATNVYNYITQQTSNNKTWITTQDYQAITAQDGTPIFGLTNISFNLAPAFANSTTILYGASSTAGVGGTGYSENGDVIYSGQYGTWRRNDSGYCYANLIRDFFSTRMNSDAINNGMAGIKMRVATQLEVMSVAVPAYARNVLALFPTLNDTLTESDRSYNSALGDWISLQAYCKDINAALIACPGITDSNHTSTVLAYSLWEYHRVACEELNIPVASLAKEAFTYYYSKDLPIGTFDNTSHPDDACHKVLANCLCQALNIRHPIL